MHVFVYTQTYMHACTCTYIYAYVIIIIKVKEAIDLRVKGHGRSWKEEKKRSDVILFQLEYI